MKCLGVTWTEKQQLSKLTVTINTKCCCIDISCTKYLSIYCPYFSYSHNSQQNGFTQKLFFTATMRICFDKLPFFWRIANYVQNNWPPPHRLRINESFFKKLIGCWLLLVRGDGLLPTVYVFIFIATLSVIFLLG